MQVLATEENRVRSRYNLGTFSIKKKLNAEILGDWTGNGEKLSSSQAEPGQAIKSAVA